MTRNQYKSNCKVHFGSEGRGLFYHGRNKFSDTYQCSSCECDTLPHGSTGSCLCCDVDPIEGAKNYWKMFF